MTQRAKGPRWRNQPRSALKGWRNARQSSRQRKGAQAQERYQAVLPVGQRSAGLQTGIARTGRMPTAQTHEVNPPVAASPKG